MLPEVPHIYRFDSLGSTNTKLKELASQGAGHGTVVVAVSQSMGRGRGDRVWTSPPGGLYFSILLKANATQRATDLSLLTGAVMAQTVKRFCPKASSVGVKWPNDCLLEQKKVGGVLSELVGDGRDALLIIGVGLNINIKASELADYQNRPFGATSFLENSAGQPFNLEDILQFFLKLFFQTYEAYQFRGFSFIQNLWEKECLFMGKIVEMRNTGLTQEKESSTGTIRGTFLGIDEQGALVLSNAQGERQSFVTGELTCCW